MDQFPGQALLQWYDYNKRPLLWRENTDPYLIWVSEIMLQQTRVDQATPYFEKFIARFPTIEALANADQQEVLKLWEGLGYYSRARNLHNGAKQVINEFGGNLPDTWESLKSIKGIGDYTASAILSIAFNKPYGVLDGNVIRVLTRYLSHIGDVTKLGVKRELQAFINKVITPLRPGDFNQAIMELGSTVCTPRKPNCIECPLNNSCQCAYSTKSELIPYKPSKPQIPHYQIVVAVIIDPKTNKILISKRKQTVMLGGLWEFPGGKVKQDEPLSEALHREIFEEIGITIDITKELPSVKHTYSHFKITLNPFICTFLQGEPKAKESDEIRWVNIHDLNNFPFPKANLKFIHLIRDYFLRSS